ncbi:MAG TPA: Uma2 family endonuclease [Chloroflexia bacterium]|nr:Uma2 family endonuclease [Chloroflexia bacterium]
MAMQQPRRRFTVDEYHRMGDAGILHEDDRVELVEGEIVVMSPINAPHLMCVNGLNKILSRSVPEELIVSVQNPIHINTVTELQPDLALITPPNSPDLKYYPGIQDILLVVEVADSTVTSDRRDKVPMYARAGIPEVWLVNIPKKVVEVYSDPAGGKYQSTMRVGRGQNLTVKMLPHVNIAIDAFLR